MLEEAVSRVLETASSRLAFTQGILKGFRQSVRTMARKFSVLRGGMRLTGFRVENYRGLRLAEMDDLESRPLTLLTGRNGTGKSLVLEAITAAWSGNINLPEFVGPYGMSLSVRLDIRLDSKEYAIVNRWRSSRGLSEIVAMDTHRLEAISTNRESTGIYSVRDELLETLQNPLFSRDHPFASIDLLSARRQVSMTTSTSVDLSLLDRATTAAQRKMMYDQEIRWKSAMQMPDVGSYLTSLDYLDYINARDGRSSSGEYERLQEIFRRATGKNISLPRYDPETTRTEIVVELPSKATHGLEDLSNGEREMLGMLYYVSQLSAQGGVLLLDEPEKHLHPTLQQAVLEAMAEVAERGQLLVVTHSPGVISSADPESVVVVEPAWAEFENQLRRVADQEDQELVLESLGLSSRDILQSDFLLLVEGVYDESRLRMLLPGDLARAKVVVAGSRSSVIQSANALRGLKLRFPWVAVIDRDFLVDSEVEEIETDGQVFVWGYRMLENVLLEADLLEEVLRPGLGDRGAEEMLKIIADSLKADAMEQFVRSRATTAKREAASEDVAAIDGFDRTQQILFREARVWAQRLEDYDVLKEAVSTEIEGDWSIGWRKYVDGKRFLAAIQRETQFYKNTSKLIDALTARAKSSVELMPEELVRLKVKLESLRPRTDHGAESPNVLGVERDREVDEAILAAGGPSPELNSETYESDPYPGC